MNKEYTIIGKKKTIDGQNFYQPDCYDDGITFGRIFKDEKAFHEDKEAVCYVPEYGFDDAKAVTIDGEEYYKEEDICAYSRKTLEALLGEDDNRYKDADGDEIDIDAFFASLLWAFPQTYLNELL